uniref:ribosomal protein L13 n=1 Tax=Merotricha bacillata TaxID=658122 RepID=UPI002114C89A|nr:ribosomal protein L13 [Merotricha bacillata]UTE94479.1 ribosomal protein L13 [Merotricha bacillata]
MKETFIPSKSYIRKNWYIIDATNQTLGRLVSNIARLLKGKNKPYYTPYLDTGDYVIVINSNKIVVTGNKITQKLYRHHSGRPGGMKIEKFENLQKRLPNKIIQESMKGMLPKGTLGRQLLKKLYVYSTDSHPHQSQKPEKINF